MDAGQAIPEPLKHYAQRGSWPAHLAKGIPQPQADFQSALGAMQYALNHEEGVTSQINKLYELAVKERDYPLQVLLHWFIEEQVEENDGLRSSPGVFWPVHGREDQRACIENESK